jgi:hypothetical protein
MAIEQNKQGDGPHVGLIRISMPLIWSLLKLPEDYQIRSSYINSSTNCVDIVVEHESLPIVEEGTLIPDVILTYTRKDLPVHLGQVDLVDIKASEH